MIRKVTLGYPYSGSLFWLLAQDNPNGFYKGKKYEGTHPYYITLYGEHEQNTINNCISLSLLFDEIHMVGADAYRPSEKERKIVGLKIFEDWSKMNDFRLSEKEVKLHLEDKTIGRILNKVPQGSARQILETTIIQNYIAKEENTTILGNSTHNLLSQRIYALHFEESDEKKIEELKNYLTGLNKIFELNSIQYSVNSFEEFKELKTNKIINDYSIEFKKQIAKLIKNDKLDELALNHKLLEIFETDSLKDKISNGLSVAATISGVLSLIAFYTNPVTAIIGAGATIAGAGTDVSSRIIDNLKNNSWLQLAPKINNTLTAKRLAVKIDELTKRD